MIFTPHTKGLLEEIKPTLQEIVKLDSALNNVIKLLNEDEVKELHYDINDIRVSICNSTKKDEFFNCKEKITDLLYKALAKRRGVKIIHNDL